MSDKLKNELKHVVDVLEEKAASPKGRRLGKLVLRVAGVLLGLFVLLVIVGSWYTTTNDFQRRVGGEVVNVLEDSVGGRVEIGHISFSLWHLAVEVDHLVIHGTEPVGEMPYLSADKILLRIRIHTFLSHTVGKGPQSHVGLNYLGIQQPHVHLIIDKNGNTNQPTPRKQSTGTEPVQNTLLDLQAGKVEITDGLAVVNDKAVPFNVAADNLNVEIHYIASSDRYGATIDLANLTTQIASQPNVQSKLHMEGEFGRDMAQLTSFDFQTGDKIHLTAEALIDHFAKPEWQADVDGTIDLKQLGYLAGIEGFYAGSADLELHGRNCVVSPAVAQRRTHFWQRRHKKLAPGAKMLPPDPDCKAGYLLVGDVKAHKVTYRIPNVNAHDVDASAQLHVTPTEMLFTALTSTLPGGGKIDGELKIENWLGEVPSDAPAASATTVAVATATNKAAKGIGAKVPVQSLQIAQTTHSHAYMTVNVKDISLRTIMAITAPENYGDLGYDTAINGPVKVEWGGAVTEISQSVQVDANLSLVPTGLKSRGYPSNIPLRGTVVGHYYGANETVEIKQLNFNTPQTTLTAHGRLGVDDGDPLTNLQVNLQAHDLSEFDQLLQTLDFEENGKKGVAAIPVVLHGTMNFNGSAKGAIEDLDVKGHLDADNVELMLGTKTDVAIDSIVGDGEYSPYAGVAIANSTVKRGTAVLNVTGTFAPRKTVSKRGVVDYMWDEGMAVNIGVKLANAQVIDALEIAGMQKKIPLTGTMNLNAHAEGPVDNLVGSGNVTLTKGEAYGESYQTISVDASMKGKEVDATKILVSAHGAEITGSGGYNIDTQHVQANVRGSGIVLSKFNAVKTVSPSADGALSLSLVANGPLKAPNLHAKLALTNLSVQGKPIGELSANADSAGSTMTYSVTSQLVGAHVALAGQTSLLGDYQTSAKLTLAGLDVAKPMQLFGTGAFKASSKVSANVTITGPAAKPMLMTGTAVFPELSVTSQSVTLTEAEPVRLSLRNGLLSIEDLHIAGQDTDLKVSGTVGVLGDNNQNGGKLQVNASGNINMAIVHTLDSDLITSGKVTFKVAADGRVKQPTLSGKVQFAGVNMAVDGIPNGLSDLNGTMVFNENRLQVENMSATTGGGRLTLGGSIAYQRGLFANLTAKGDNVRVRLYGLSTTANASFQLQGGQSGLLLSGNVFVTRFGVGPDVDFAAFSGTGGVQAPTDPDALTNKIRMDVHVISSPQLDFQNSYAKLAGNVDLHLGGTIATPSVLGKIQITDGSATFAGTKYELERGTIYFSNPVRIDPTIDLDATARVENYDITIGVHGTATNIKPTYRSEPPLTEADIFNLLALGRTQEEAQLYQEQQVQAGTDPTTSALLGGALNATVSSRVGKLFGAGSVKIDPAFVGTLGNSSARITVEEPLGKQLTLIFATNVNQTAQQLIQLKYQIDQDHSLVATRDESGVFSIVYKLRKRYR